MWDHKDRVLVRLLLILMCFWVVFPAEAQVTDSTNQFIPPNTQLKVKSRYHIQGVVLEKTDNEPVAFATVFLQKSQNGTIADENGVFHLFVDDLTADTLVTQLIGYTSTKQYITPDNLDSFYTLYMPLAASSLKEVVVRPGEDPAITIIKNVIRNKEKNDPDKLSNYGYEAYNTVELDIVNLSKEKFEKLPVPMLKHFSYIYDNVDSSGDKPFLPFYLTETLSDYYYQKKPKKTKEYIRATQVKGLENKSMKTSVTKYLGNMYLSILPYDNFIYFFDKEYVSPIGNAGLVYYKYKITDTIERYGHRVIELSFKPNRVQTNTFSGTIRIVDSIYALQYIEADLPKGVNINWLKNAHFYKDYQPIGDSLWFCTNENLTAELLLAAEDGLAKLPGVIARKTNSYRKVKINDPFVTEMVNSAKLKLDVVVADTASNKSDTYWQTVRHDSLSENEKSIYFMLDSIQADPVYVKFKNFAKIFFTGVVKLGPIEIGPYWNIYSNNLVEGNRFRFSMGTTRKLSTKLYLNGYLAYGTQDERFKYNFTAFYMPQKYPRSYINFTYTSDIDRTVNYYDRVSFDNILSVTMRKNGIPWKFMFSKDARLELYKEYTNGFSHQLSFIHKTFDPYDPLPDVTIFRDEAGTASNSVVTSEVNLLLRYAPKERFLEGDYYRFSLGSEKPIFQIRYALGIKGIWNSAYDYHRVVASVSDNIKIPPLGSIYVNVFAGKYFGTLPYPLLEQHPGNENYTYNKYAFNMMNQYEFISDQFIGANIEHSIGGGIFQFIPLVKKLKFRQFWTAKGVIGSLSDENKALNLNKGFTFRTLQDQPYVELGTGVENIFKLFRVDCVWRVTPKSLPDEKIKRDFGVFGSVKFTF